MRKFITALAAVACVALVGGAAVAEAKPAKATVVAVQQKLGVTADGVIGPQTRRALKRFQRRNGLTVDGVIGPQTVIVPDEISTSVSLVSADFNFYGERLKFPIFVDYFSKSFDNHPQVMSEEKPAHTVRFPPAEKPSMPTRSGLMPRAPLFERTRVTARCASWTIARLSGICISRFGTRYLSSTAVTPTLLSHSQTSEPSCSIARMLYPPPGATTTAAPVFFSAGGE